MRLAVATRAALRAELADAKLRQIAATETAEAFGAARAAAAERIASHHLLYRVWDATLDKRTCPRCSRLDGVAVGLGTSFDGGATPGAVHPWCRCTEWILPVEMLP